MAINTAKLDKPLEFPEGASPDDTWLSAYVGSRFGIESVSYLSNSVGEYIPPTTKEDMLAQAARHSLCRPLVRHEHPHLSGYFRQVDDYYNAQMSPKEFRVKWREEALRLGVNFDDRINEYNDFMDAVKAEAATLFDSLLAMNGLWSRIQSTKSPVSSNGTR